MGQAKKRGTFEERKAKAVAIREQKFAEYKETLKKTGGRNSPLAVAWLVASGLMAGGIK